MNQDNPRRSDLAIQPQFLDRWSPRAFSDAVMEPVEMLTLLEAARWAPSASNNQPWRLVWALRGEAEFAAITACLSPGNQAWAPKAAGVVVVATKKVVERDGQANPNQWAEFDAGAAWAQLGLQARAMGLYAHAMGGFDATALAQAVNLPADHLLMAVVVVGQRGKAEDLPEAQRAREAPNGRLPLAEVTRHGKF